MSEIMSETAVATPASRYHDRTKHRFSGYAKGPDTLDWDLQPNPFRRFDGASVTDLPLAPQNCEGARPDLRGLGALLHLSFGLSAWKQFGPDRWALRCNPSSGNLHPTEAYAIAQGIAGLDDGLYHYAPREHVLEQRRRDEAATDGPARLWIGLSSIHWREAWKYGERAFRYCQLDMGHALGAIGYAAAALGFSARLVEGLSGAQGASLLGLDRDNDFVGRAEHEDFEALVEILFNHDTADVAPPALRDGAWAGSANVLDRHPMYRWPVIGEVAQRTTAGATAPSGRTALPPPALPDDKAALAELILQRRSAQHFDPQAKIPAAEFFALVAKLHGGAQTPWPVWTGAAKVHPVFFVHRVEGLEPGLYALPRSEKGLALLRQNFSSDYDWAPVEGAPDAVPLVHLKTGDGRGAARRLFCNQAIASDGCFAVSMLAEFSGLADDQNIYRSLHWEAGLLGQVLYIEAERFGYRGTGVGCFFDDETREFFGVSDPDLQIVYHFTFGAPLTDARIATEPAYPDKSRPEDFSA